MANRLRRWLAGKVLGEARFPKSGLWGFDWMDAFGLKTPTDEDFAKAVQQAHRASVVMGCIEFLVANATSTPWQIKDSDGTIIDQHAALDLLNEPMPGEDGEGILSGWLQSLALNGNGFGIEIDARSGSLSEIMYVPHTSMQVARGPRGEVSGYIYRVDGMDIPLAREEVIHIRRYKDLERVHYGRSPIAALGPEIWLDTEATRMVAAIMKNRGMPGGILSPEPVKDATGETLTLSDDDLSVTREYLGREYTGDKRGNWLVFGEAMRATLLNYDHRLLDMSNVHKLAEERVTCGDPLPGRSRRIRCRPPEQPGRSDTARVRAAGMAGGDHPHAEACGESLYPRPRRPGRPGGRAASNLRSL